MGLVHHPNVVTDGLVGCWDAGNRRSYPGAGLDWTDLAGGANGTITNSGGDAIDFIDEKGGYLDFDGADDYVACPQPNYDTTGDWSWCMWLNRITSGAPTYPVMFGYGVDEGTRIFWYNSGSDVKIGLYSQESSGPQPTVTDRFPANEWCMFALKKEGNFVYFCFDADEWTEYIRTGAGNGYYWGTDEFIWKDIGKGHTTYYWHGYMASVHMYNRGISFDEVKQNYEATKSRFLPRITKSGLVGNWDAGDPNSYSGGTTCKDTANGTTATLENNGTNLNFNSANGGYWEFDGTDDYIQCSTNSVLQPQSLSLEAWVYDDQNESHRPIASWKTTAEHPSVWTRFTGSATGPLLYMNGADYRYFNNTAASVTGWHHFVFTYTYDDITTGVLYIDGAAIAIGYTPHNNSKDSSDTFRIGRANTYYYKGSIALVRIYDNALSAAEILDNYQAAKGRFT